MIIVRTFDDRERRPMKNNENGYTNLTNDCTAGITLVEIVVAALILIASLTVLLISFSRVKHNAGTARRELNAMHIARTEMEQLCSTNYLNITSYPATNLSDSFFVPLGGQKQCTVVSNNSGYKTISLSVSWRSTVGTPTISQTFHTIICNTN